MDDVLSRTIAKNYSDLIGCYNQINQIKWDRVYTQPTPGKTKRRKASESCDIKKLSTDDKNFLKIQKTLVILGIHINQKEIPVDRLLKEKVEAQNYDELITNIKWSKRDECLDFFVELDKLCSKVFNNLYQMDGEWTIRKNTRRLLNETMLILLEDREIENRKVVLQTIANDIESSIMVYTLLMVSEVCNGDLRSIDWTNSLLKCVYLSKSNCILSSLTNKQYNMELIEMLINESVYPIEIAFLKRSQLLSKFYSDLESNKKKIYEESGISQGDDDYEKYNSLIRCWKCKLKHTSFSQLQTRGADEPMTIFWYCHKCKINGRG